MVGGGEADVRCWEGDYEGGGDEGGEEGEGCEETGEEAHCKRCLMLFWGCRAVGGGVFEFQLGNGGWKGSELRS